MYHNIIFTCFIRYFKLFTNFHSSPFFTIPATIFFAFKLYDLEFFFSSSMDPMCAHLTWPINFLPFYGFRVVGKQIRFFTPLAPVLAFISLRMVSLSFLAFLRSNRRLKTRIQFFTIFFLSQSVNITPRLGLSLTQRFTTKGINNFLFPLLFHC